MGNKLSSGALFFVFLAVLGGVGVGLGLLGYYTGTQAGNSGDVSRSVWSLGIGAVLLVLCVPFVVYKLRQHK